MARRLDERERKILALLKTIGKANATVYNSSSDLGIYIPKGDKIHSLSVQIGNVLTEIEQDRLAA